MLSPLLPRNRPWPDIPPPAPKVSASALSPDEKRQLWHHLKAHKPEKAAFFDDPIVKALMAQGAVAAFDPEDLAAAGIARPLPIQD